MSAPVLVLGRAGQVARALVRAGETARTPVTAAGRETLDLRKRGDLAGLIRSTGAQGVINASGYTAVDAAETEIAAAERLNAHAPAEMAQACEATGVPLVHLSTDYVFDGAAGGAPYAEDAATNPLNVYGRTKLAGERAVLASGARAAVIRTSWVYDAAGQNFVRTMLRLADSMDEIAVVDDQRGRPTFAGDIATGALVVLDALLQGERPGLLHLAGGGDASWAEFAEAIFRQSGRRTRVKPVATADRPSPAARPKDSRLATDKIAAFYGLRPAPWTERLGDCLREMETVPA